MALESVKSDRATRLDPRFVVKLSLMKAPQRIQKDFRNAFTLLLKAVLKQRQLTETTFLHLGDVKDSVNVIEEVCSRWELIRRDVDPDRVVWVDEAVLQNFFIRPGQWVNLSKYYDDHDNQELNLNSGTSFKFSYKESSGFVCQILPIPSEFRFNSSCCNQELKFNSILEYNLRRTLNLSSFVQLPPLRIRPLLSDSVFDSPNKSCSSFSPIQGKVVKLTGLKCSEQIAVKECDILLHDLFAENCKYLCVGDIICSSVDNHSTRKLDLIVTEINEKRVDRNGGESCREIFKVTQHSSRVSLNCNELTNYFHRKCDTNELNKILTPVLMASFGKLCGWITRALSALQKNKMTEEMWPSFLLFGGVGTGKYSVCYAASLHFGLNFYFVNASNLIGDTSAYTEAKLRATYEKIKNSLSPCILFIKNIHLLGKDKDGHEDKRVLIAVKEFLHDVAVLSTSKPCSSSNIKSVMTTSVNFVVGSTDKVESMVPAISQQLLFRMQLQSAGSSSTEAYETVKWLMEKSSVKLDETVDLKVWVAQNCEGVQKTYGDLKAIATNAVRNAFDRSSKICGPIGNEFKIIQTDLDIGLQSVNAAVNKATSSLEIPNVSWEDIGGLEDIKQELINSVKLPLEYPQLFAAGVRRSGILLYGPPGTGKTLIAKAVATEFKLSFLSVKGPELLNMYVGQSEQNVRDVFTKARDAAPCIIFFDELDALAPNRGRAGDSGGVMDRVVSQILAELDGTHSTPDVFIIGATNRPDLIDPALLRPGRFDKLLYVGINHDSESKTNVLQALTRKFQLSSDVNLRKLADSLPQGMSGADLYSLCSDAYMKAVERQIADMITGEVTGQLENDRVVGVTIEQDDFNDAISRATSSLTEDELLRYEDLKMLKR